MKTIIKTLVAFLCISLLLTGCNKTEDPVIEEPTNQSETNNTEKPETPTDVKDDDQKYIELLNANQEKGKQSFLRLYDFGDFELHEINNSSEFIVKGKYSKEGNVYMFSNFDGFVNPDGEQIYNFEFFEQDDGSLILNGNLYVSKANDVFTVDGNVPDWYQYYMIPETPTEGNITYKFVHDYIEGVMESDYPTLIIYDNGDFKFIENAYAGLGEFNGWYQMVDDTYICHITDTNLNGFNCGQGVGCETLQEIVFDITANGSLVLKTDLVMSRTMDEFFVKIGE